MKIFKVNVKQDSELNLTPLIDIIFILLVFFMVNASFLTPALKIKLPVASSKEQMTQQKMSLYITEDLSLYFNKTRMSQEDIYDCIGIEIQKDPNLVVTVFCDKSVTFEYLVHIINLLKISGVKNVSISHRNVS